MTNFMQPLGFNLICFAITFLIITIFGYDMTIKEQIKMIVIEVISLALLTVGVSLLVTPV